MESKLYGLFRRKEMMCSLMYSKCSFVSENLQPERVKYRHKENVIWKNLVPGPTIKSPDFLGDFLSFQGKYRHPSVRNKILKLHFMLRILRSWRVPSPSHLPPNHLNLPCVQGKDWLWHSNYTHPQRTENEDDTTEKTKLFSLHAK